MNVMMSLTATPLLEYGKLPSNMALQSRMLLQGRAILDSVLI